MGQLGSVPYGSWVFLSDAQHEGEEDQSSPKISVFRMRATTFVSDPDNF